MSIGIATTRYSAVFRRILESYGGDAVILLDGKRYGPADVPVLLQSWCTNREIERTQDFSLDRHGQTLFSFHDHPDELMVAESEARFVDQLVADRLARRDGPVEKPRQSDFDGSRWSLGGLLRRFAGTLR